MVRNKLIVLTLAGLILAVSVIGNASATTVLFGEGATTGMGSADTPGGTYKTQDASGTIYPMTTDYVGWKNDFYNQLSYWQYGTAAYSCDELHISYWQVTVPAFTDIKQNCAGYLGGNRGTYGIYGMNHIYFGNGPAHATEYNSAVPTFNEW